MDNFYLFNNFLIFILLISVNNINSQKFIILPFEEYSYNNNYPTVLDFLKSQFLTNIYTPLKIGTPFQTLLTFIKTEEPVFIINDYVKFYNKTNYGYNPKNSSSFKNITALNGKYFYFGYSLINETISFCKDENSKNVSTFPNFQLNLIPLESFNNKEKSLTGEFGFIFSVNDYNTGWLKTIHQLKKGGYINSYKISMIYKGEHNGFFIIGEDPHIYDSNNFKENQKLTSYMKYNTSDYYIYYRLQMDKIYFYDDTDKISFLDQNLEIKFYFEYGIILGPKNYYNKIKEAFFNKYDKICTENYISVTNKNLTVYTCQANNFNIKEFPALYFYNQLMNYTFELNYNDLFYKNGDKYIFLVAFDEFDYQKWKIGKPFLKKYQLTFDSISKTINFYNKAIKKENQEKNMGKIILIFAIFIVFGISLFFLGYFLGKKLNEARKKKANELGDDFDYPTNNNENNDQLYETLNNK